MVVKYYKIKIYTNNGEVITTRYFVISDINELSFSSSSFDLSSAATGAIWTMNCDLDDDRAHSIGLDFAGNAYILGSGYGGVAVGADAGGGGAAIVLDGEFGVGGV